MPSLKSIDLIIFFPALLVIIFSVLILRSIAPSLFPLYFFYILLGIVAFILFSKTDFEIISAFYKPYYIVSIILLLITLFLGQLSRGAIRWIPIGPFTFQPAEIIRPFILIFFAVYFSQGEVSFVKLIRGTLLFVIPLILIVVQPSLGISILTAFGFFGVVVASSVNKKYLGIAALIGIVSLPLLWGVVAPYQKQRIISFINPSGDPLGAGYNSIQSTISVGSGKLFGKGLGKGVQTQLAFLPEKHTDFVFAAVSEETGFLGASLLLFGIGVILYRIVVILERVENPVESLFLTGVFLVLLVQTVVNVGMNVGILPITGVPLPLVSAGGSSFLATMISLGIVSSIGGKVKPQL